MPRPLRAIVSLSALRNNLAVARSHSPQARVLAVVKANAYGHGMQRVAAALSSADGFAVLDIESALCLRESGQRGTILLLEGFFEPGELMPICEHRLTAVLHDAQQADVLMQARLPAPIDVFVKLNTGMNRLGLLPAQLTGVLQRLRDSANVGNVTLMTHFACADDDKGVAWQLDVFQAATSMHSLPVSLANSAALLRYPELAVGWVRPGIMLYGASPFGDRTAAELGLQPAMTLESRIIAIQNLRAGDIVGYGATFTAARAMRVGVVACGYADGYPRHAPSGTPVLVDGNPSGTVGRVSMDMLCVDLTHLPQAGVGASVVLWGVGLPVEEIASRAGTISYELLCALAARVPIEEVA